MNNSHVYMTIPCNFLLWCVRYPLEISRLLFYSEKELALRVDTPRKWISQSLDKVDTRVGTNSKMRDGESGLTGNAFAKSKSGLFPVLAQRRAWEWSASAPLAEPVGK